MMSYVLQGFASITFGPLLGLLFVFFSSQPTSDSYFALSKNLPVATYLLPMATNIHQSNLIVALSVLVSSVKRLQTTTPLAENTFIIRLVWYQMLAAVIGTASYALIHEWAANRRAFLVTFHMLAVGVTFIFIVYTQHVYPPEQGHALRGITAACSSEQGWPVVYVSVAVSMAERVAKAQPTQYRSANMGQVEGFFGGAGTLIIVIIVIYLAWILAYCIRECCIIAYIEFCRLVRLKPRRVAGIAFAATWTVSSACFAAFAMKSLFQQRDQHRKASLGSLVNDEWGFGQVMAVMAWIPLLQDMSIALWGEYLPAEHLRWENMLIAAHLSPDATKYGWERYKQKPQYTKLEPEGTFRDVEAAADASAPQSSSVDTCAPGPGALSRRETWEREEDWGHLTDPIAG
jgi:hypothetical protein